MFNFFIYFNDLKKRFMIPTLLSSRRALMLQTQLTVHFDLMYNFKEQIQIKRDIKGRK